ncbi:UbiX family flavin prenyltransferase [Deferrisoma camini]|uniref:UbiX family flavin prenyltransferase n=1 Tax=Deferrisoma camini TaxID=1035120 RepID=UPI00046D3A1E|nr:UbiX family flavin prenyltransferase [Deferrisoma camini]
MRRIVVGITGASGVVYGVRLLQVLRQMPAVETHLILSAAARQTLVLETEWAPETVEALADRAYDPGDLAAPIASGSVPTAGMVVAPCSMKTLSAIAHSYADNLIVRAADVTLKERRPLVLVPRETPLHKGHLELMLRAADLGAALVPPMVAFYHRPTTIDEVVDHTVGKVLELLGLEHQLYRRWHET